MAQPYGRALANLRGRRARLLISDECSSETKRQEMTARPDNEAFRLRQEAEAREKANERRWTLWGPAVARSRLSELQKAAPSSRENRRPPVALALATTPHVEIPSQGGTGDEQ